MLYICSTITQVELICYDNNPLCFAVRNKNEANNEKRIADNVEMVSDEQASISNELARRKYLIRMRNKNNMYDDKATH